MGKHKEQTTWFNTSIGKVIYAGALGMCRVPLSDFWCTVSDEYSVCDVICWI